MLTLKARTVYPQDVTVGLHLSYNQLDFASGACAAWK